MSKKNCLRCKERKPLNCFGRDRSRRDNHNPYCMSCVKVLVREHRDRKRAMKQARKQAHENAAIQRKQNVISPILRSSINKVRYAVKQGCRTRAAIRTATGLGWDDIGDALAELAFCRNEIRIVRANEEAEFQLVAAWLHHHLQI